jgi:hypothetical protein
VTPQQAIKVLHTVRHGDSATPARTMSGEISVNATPPIGRQANDRITVGMISVMITPNNPPITVGNMPHTEVTVAVPGENNISVELTSD